MPRRHVAIVDFAPPLSETSTYGESERAELMLDADWSRKFASESLQHPVMYSNSLDHAWAALYQIYISQMEPRYIFASLRACAAKRVALPWTVPPRTRHFLGAPSITIADLDDFAADAYPDRLDEWCRAGLAIWGGVSSSDSRRVR